MDNIIFTFYSVIDAALNVFKDRRNANLVIRIDSKRNDDTAVLGEISAFSLTIDRASKIGTNFIIGRHKNADIVLTDPAVNARHCTISIGDTSVLVLREQSTNGTLINGKHCNHQNFEIQNEMRIDIRDAAFDIRVPWRNKYQQNYEYETRKANKKKARTSFEFLPSKSTLTYTAWMKTLEPYTFTNIFIDSFKLRKNEMNKIEIVRKNHFFFVAKKFNRKRLDQQKFRV